MPGRMYWFLLEVPEIIALEKGSVEGRSWLGLTREEARSVVDAIWKLPKVVNVGERAMPATRRLAESIRDADGWAAFGRRSALMELLYTVIEASRAQTAGEDERVEILERAKREIFASRSSPPTVADLADRLNVSRSHLHRVFRECLGETPKGFIERIRLEEGCRLLCQSDASIKKIAHELGYATSQHFATVFRRFTRHTPSQWRSLNRGEL